MAASKKTVTETTEEPKKQARKKASPKPQVKEVAPIVEQSADTKDVKSTIWTMIKTKLIPGAVGLVIGGLGVLGAAALYGKKHPELGSDEPDSELTESTSEPATDWEAAIDPDIIE